MNPYLKHLQGKPILKDMEAVNKNGFVENIGKPNRIIFAGYIKKHSWSAGKVKLLFIQLVKARFKKKNKKEAT